MRSKGGYWQRPTARTYMYNLDVGEHYYSPMTSYLEAERGTRGETPGALTFDERLQRSWLHGRRYEASEARERYASCSSLAKDTGSGGFRPSALIQAREVDTSKQRYARCSSLARDTGSGGFMPSALRQARAASEVRTSATASQAQAAQAASAYSMSASRQQASSQQASVKSSRVEQTTVQEKKTSASMASKKEEASLTASKQVASKQVASRSSAASSSAAASSRKVVTESSRKIDDDVSKKIADIHITPFTKGQELDAANAASARARARILELEKELEEITRKAMTTQTKALKTAKQMAAEAYLADEASMSANVKKTKKVMIESSAKIN